MEIAFAALVAVLIGAGLVYFFYLRKPAPRQQPREQPWVAPQQDRPRPQPSRRPVPAPAPEPEGMELDADLLNSLSEVPQHGQDIVALKAQIAELKEQVEIISIALEGMAEDVASAKTADEAEIEEALSPGITVGKRRNGHDEQPVKATVAAPVEPLPVQQPTATLSNRGRGGGIQGNEEQRSEWGNRMVEARRKKRAKAAREQAPE